MSGATSQRLAGLDGLRAVAVTLVILAHVRITDGFPPWAWLDAVGRQGAIGVEIFFVLSGFLITWLLLREEQGSARIDLRSFYFRRVIRILPPAFAYLLCVALVGGMMNLVARPASLAASALFVRNYLTGSEQLGVDAHFWSLSIEEQFYLVWPFLLGRIPRPLRIPAATALLLFAPIWRQINMWMWGGANLNWNRTDLRYDALIAGCLLAMLWLDPLWGPRLQRMARWPSGLFLGGALVFVAAVWQPFPSPRWLVPGRMTVALIAVAVVVLALVEARPGVIRACFNFGPVVWLGRISYSLYLWQQLFCTTRTDGNWLQRCPQNIAAALVMAAASYYCLERPCLRRRDRWQLRWLGRRAPALAPPVST